MKPSDKYEEFLQQSGFYHDTVQQHIMFMLDRLYEEIGSELGRDNGLLTDVLKHFSNNLKNIRGLYIWGGVGRGKTFLMDVFYQSLAIKQKKRLHFHQFMKFIHDELSMARKGRDPIKNIASKFTRDTRVLCLDEFVVTDIGDAMLTARLLQALFDEGLILITTSNTPPEALYKDGLQRSSFLPTIDLLLQHCQVTCLQGENDYRSMGLKDTKMYQCPHDDLAVSSIQQYLSSHLLSGEKEASVSINGRDIHYQYCAEDTIWFTFNELCKSARSRLDYLELAQSFNTLVLTGIEQMGNHANDVARRFISLIDVLYDHRVKFICSAAVSIDELYPQGFLQFDFQRTISRLKEMQDVDYIALSHRI